MRDNKSSRSGASGVNQEGSTASSRATAGRNLDALVAEKVMGWHKIQDGIRWAHANGNVARFVHGSHSWTPSRSIADAWEVVEKMREGGWVVGIYIDDEPWEDSAGVGTHHCSLLGCNRGRADCTDIRESADTTPLVICIAALRAMDAHSAVDSSWSTPKTNPDDA